MKVMWRHATTAQNCDRPQSSYIATCRSVPLMPYVDPACLEPTWMLWRKSCQCALTGPKSWASQLLSPEKNISNIGQKRRPQTRELSDQ